MLVSWFILYDSPSNCDQYISPGHYNHFVVLIEMFQMSILVSATFLKLQNTSSNHGFSSLLSTVAFKVIAYKQKLKVTQKQKLNVAPKQILKVTHKQKLKVAHEQKLKVTHEQKLKVTHKQKLKVAH